MSDTGIIKITVESGYELAIDKDSMNDMELLEDLVELDKGNIAVLPDISSRLLGDGKADVYAHIKKATGKNRVGVDDFQKFIKEIVDALGKQSSEGKNS